MTATTSIIQPIGQADIQSYNSMQMVATLQAELEKLQAKIENYYHDEIVLRGDKILMREYRGYFDLKTVE